MIGQRGTVGVVAVGCVAGLLVLAGGCAKQGESALPVGAATAIRAAFPGAEIDEVEVDSEGGVRLYEVELTYEGKEVEVEVSADGVIAEVETEVAMADLPKAVADAIAKAAGAAKVHEIERTEVRAVVRDGKLVPLSAPKVVYEAEFMKGGKEVEIEVAADGTILKTETDDDDD